MPRSVDDRPVEWQPVEWHDRTGRAISDARSARRDARPEPSDSYVSFARLCNRVRALRVRLRRVLARNVPSPGAVCLFWVPRNHLDLSTMSDHRETEDQVSLRPWPDPIHGKPTSLRVPKLVRFLVFRETYEFQSE